jgi:hypothetical protein
MERRAAPLAMITLLATAALAQLRVGDADFLPKNLLFTVVDEASRVTAEGKLAGECTWSLQTETSVGQIPKDKCAAFYYRTVILLKKSCPDPAPSSTQRTERILYAGTACPEKPFVPESEAKVLSMGTNSDGKRHEVFEQPDGTRVTLVAGPTGAIVTVKYPDGSTDGFKTP